jgi:LacI family transcriptional regulator
MDKAPLIAVGIEFDWPISHHYDILRAVLHYGQELGWSCRVEPGLTTSKLVTELPDAYDGVIARASSELADCCRKLNVPLVNVWANSPVSATHTITSDHEEIGRLAAHYLVARGFRTFGYLARSNDITAEENLEGIRSVLNPKGLECAVLNSDVPFELSDWKDYRHSITDWLADRPLPLAIIASGAVIARHFADQCLKCGLLIPDDIAIISCQDDELVCGGITPALTSINCGFEDVGRVAVEMLANMLAGQDVPTMRRAKIDALITERRSTDVHPVDDRVVARALRFIWDHSHHAMTVVDVADATGMTRRSLERRFRSVLDQSINEKILESRVERAKRILEETDDPIKSVALAAGFSSCDRMGQVFGQHLGMTPTQYRTDKKPRISA